MKNFTLSLKSVVFPLRDKSNTGMLEVVQKEQFRRNVNIDLLMFNNLFSTSLISTCKILIASECPGELTPNATKLKKMEFFVLIFI